MLDALTLPPESFVDYLLRGTLTFLFAAIGARVLAWLIWWISMSRLRLGRAPLSERRRVTLRDLIRSLLDGLAVLITLLVVLSMFVEPSALITAVGLFSAGIGFAARPYISDFLGGIVLLFEDQFALGDKVEIGDRTVMGVVERVSLRTTQIRGEAGELWIVPNGDVRTIRNFTRASFSPANIKLTVPTARLDEVLGLLTTIVGDPGPGVIAPPEIISAEGAIGETTELILKVRAQYGHSPQVRQRLLEQLQALLIEHGIIHGAQQNSAELFCCDPVLLLVHHSEISFIVETIDDGR
jgi:small conductance mechanosensitive channel